MGEGSVVTWADPVTDPPGMSASWPLSTSLPLGALPGATPCARLHARVVLTEWGLGELAEAAELIVSELVTNAVRASTAPDDLPHLRRCVELAAEAVDAGDHPFGSVLVAADGRVLAEDRNRENTMADATRHPEFELARWAAANMTAADRAAATVFTSGEHCPMCAAAHAWVGLGRIVYVSSSEQLTAWLAELGVPPSPVRALAVREVAPGLTVQGPVPELDEQVRELHRRFRA